MNVLLKYSFDVEQISKLCTWELPRDDWGTYAVSTEQHTFPGEEMKNFPPNKALSKFDRLNKINLRRNRDDSILRSWLLSFSFFFFRWIDKRVYKIRKHLCQCQVRWGTQLHARKFSHFFFVDGGETVVQLNWITSTKRKWNLHNFRRNNR